MRQLSVILLIAFAVVAAAQSGYKYDQPLLGGGPISGSGTAPLPISILNRPSLPSPLYNGPSVLGPIPGPFPLPVSAPQHINPGPGQSNLYVPPPPPPPSLPQQQHGSFGGYEGGSVLHTSPIQSQPQQQQQQFSANIDTGYSQGYSSAASSSSSSSVAPLYQRPQTAIITKDIYIHSAPDDHEEHILQRQLDSAPIRKNYRIVFIKAPTQNFKLAANALKRAQASSEEKTVIYVLSKKSDFGELQQQLQQNQGVQKLSKPEVYFIKYKTQEEAQRAQQEIQAQYDSLGGSTHISDEGIAPLATVNGIGGGGGGAFNLGPLLSNLGDGPSQKYLPPSNKK